MNVLYSFEGDRCEAAISDDSDWMLFNGVADAILRRFRAKLVERLDAAFLEDRISTGPSIGPKPDTRTQQRY